jgi:histidinol-phosphatase
MNGKKENSLNADWRARYEQGIAFARAAGKIALGYFDTNLTVETKGDDSPVTIADRETERSLRSAISAAFPGDGFLGEEFGDTPGTTGYRWILDPIDGTRSFVRGIETWAVLVGLEYKGEMIAGIIDAPTMDFTWHALRGNGAYRNERRIHVSKERKLEKSLVFYSSLSWFLKAGREQNFIELVRRSERQRGYGDWFGFMLVAQGSGEVMVEHGVHAWDVGAIVPIMEEAGGKYTNWSNKVDIHSPDAFASNGLLHDEVLAIINPW